MHVRVRAPQHVFYNFGELDLKARTIAISDQMPYQPFTDILARSFCVSTSARSLGIPHDLLMADAIGHRNSKGGMYQWSGLS